MNNKLTKLNKTAVVDALFPLYLVNFIGVLGFSMVIPFMYILIDRLDGSPVMYGLISASYPAFQLIGAPLLGRWSDKIGRKKVLVISQVGTFISWIVLLFSLYIPQAFEYIIELRITGIIVITLPLLLIFLSRAFDGLTGGNIAVANAFLADLTTEKDRNKNYGRLSISSNLGFVIGPALAGILGSTVYREALPIIAAMVVSGIAIIVIVYFLPDRARIKKTSSITESFNRAGKKSSSIFKIKGVLSLCLIYFLIFFAFNTYYTAFPVHVVEDFNWSVGQIGYFFSALSLLMIVAQGPILQILSEIFSELKLVLAGSLLLIFNFALLIANIEWILYLTILFFALGNGLMWPSFLSLLSRKGTEENQGQIQGVASSFGSLASIAGLVIGGVLYPYLAANTFIISVVSILIVTIYFLYKVFKEKECLGINKPEYCSLLPNPLSNQEHEL